MNAIICRGIYAPNGLADCERGIMSKIDEFLAAVDAADDERAEALCGQLPPRAETVLLPLTHADSADLRWWAVRALAECGSAQAADALVAALRDDDPGVRAVAARVLAHLQARHPAAVRPHLAQIAQLLLDRDGLVRQSAADALALCGDSAVPILAAILDAPAADRAPGDTDGLLDDSLLNNSLLNNSLFNNELYNNEGARSRAAQALHKIATMETAPVLYRHLEDPNILVRTHAYEALDEMGLLENRLITLS